MAVPLSAVFTERGERFVFVKSDEKFERRLVQIGITDLSFAEVQKGLTNGETVALEMPSDVKPEPEQPVTRKKKKGQTGVTMGSSSGAAAAPRKSVL